MSRRPPSDAFTRFTSTAPQSSNQPSSSANSPFTAGFSPNTKTTQSPSTQIPKQPSSSPSNPTETPAERVARLRAAHRANVANNQLTPVDRLIARGRTVADAAHRITTYSLLAITGVSTVIAVYGLVSLVSHNRRQKRAWIEREMDRLTEAQRAFLRGEADAEQLHLLEQERAGEELIRRYAEDKKRRREEGTWNRIKGTFGSFTGRGDMGLEAAEKTGAQRQQEIRNLSVLVEAAGQEGKEKLLEHGWESELIRPVAVRNGPVEGVGLDAKGRPVPINKVERIRRDGEKEVTSRTGISGGPLDVLADNIVDKTSSTSSSWWNWVTGGGKGPSTSTSTSTS